MIAAFLLALAQSPPDVVVFVMDDVSTMDLALYGGPVSCPNLEALAAQGVNFTRAYANPTCAPSRRSLLAGHWWLTGNGFGCPGDSPDANTPQPSEAFLPEVIPHTSGVVGKWHLGTDPLGISSEIAPGRHGFDRWAAGSHGNVPSCGGDDYTEWLRVDAGPGYAYVAISTAYEPKAVRSAFVSGWPVSASPKFALVSPNLAHAPYHAPPPSVLPPGYVVGGTVRLKFEAMIAAYDFLLGQMLAVVDLQTTLVVVVGDNGTPPQVSTDKAKGTTFERGVRVPLVMAGLPVNAPGRSVGELVHLVDIWATLADVGSGSIPGGSPWPLVGVSLRPILEDAPHPPIREWALLGTGWGTPGGEAASIRSDGTKLRVVDLDGDGFSDTTALYDLTTDPTEDINRDADPAYAFRFVEHMAWLSQALP